MPPLSRLELEHLMVIVQRERNAIDEAKQEFAMQEERESVQEAIRVLDGERRLLVGIYDKIWRILNGDANARLQ